MSHCRGVMINHESVFARLERDLIVRNAGEVAQRCSWLRKYLKRVDPDLPSFFNSSGLPFTAAQLARQL
jgi:hypothetical protein